MDKEIMELFNKTKKENLVHLRVQKRSNRKFITTVQGLEDDLDLKKLLKAFRIEFNCNGTLLQDEDMGEIIQLQGDQRKNVLNFLITEKICDSGKIKMHGF